MKKDYQKPEVELISLVAEEKIAVNSIDVGVEGEMGTGSNDLFQP